MRKQFVFSGIATAIFWLSSTVYSEENVELEKFEVRGGISNAQKAGRLVDVIQRTELISAEKIQQKNASMLTEAIAGETGVRVSNECSMCGVKRVMVNGMKGEHTTVLIDGVPLFSGVAGFYGMDAITSAGIGRIEIARGAGASLVSPEAIGGTINIMTKFPTENSLVLDAAAGEDGFSRFSLTGTAISDDKATRIIGAAQYDDRDQFDGDNNGVSENPSLENRSIFAKISHDINDYNTVDLRLASYHSEVFGGPLNIGKSATLASYNPSLTSTPTQLFANGDVNQLFTGQPWETVEIVDTDRIEITGLWITNINDRTWMEFTGAYAEHEQDSFYEGFDYYADDDLYYYDAKLNYVFNDQHLLTFGIDYRDEKMRSRSRAVEADPNLTSDSYDHTDVGFYIQDEWTPTANLEISLAVRVDHIEVDFVDQVDGDVINKTLVAPRAHIRYTHNDHWTSRFSAGKGYRAPLSIFETEHGILEDGFNIAIDDIEESWSSNYSLSYESERFSAVASLGWTEVDQLAATDDSQAVLTLVNTDMKVRSTVFDLAAGYEITESLKFNGGVEYYDYSSSFKDTFAIAPIELRIRAGLDYASGPWKVSSNVTWVDSRDLDDYGYVGRFNVNDDGTLGDTKGTHAPSFFTVDARVEYQFNKNLNLYAGGTNLFDYNQTDEESPLFWDADGGYDVVHIYAPLRGRVLYGGFKLNF